MGCGGLGQSSEPEAEQKWNAAAGDGRRGGGLNCEVGGVPVVFHFTSTSDYGTLARGTGVTAARGEGGGRGRPLIPQPALSQRITGRLLLFIFFKDWKHDGR